ncbi:MAG: flagellar hook-length control protein FliK [Thermacetogeniaceae bacterium]
MDAKAAVATQLLPNIVAAIDGKAGERAGKSTSVDLFLELLTALLTGLTQGKEKETKETIAGFETSAALPSETEDTRGKEKGLLPDETAALSMLLPQNIKLLDPQTAPSEQSSGCSGERVSGQEVYRLSLVGSPTQDEGTPLLFAAVKENEPLRLAGSQSDFQTVSPGEAMVLSGAGEQRIEPDQQLPQTPQGKEAVPIGSLNAGSTQQKMLQEPGSKIKDAPGRQGRPSENASSEVTMTQQKLGIKTELLKQRPLKQSAQVSLKAGEGTLEGSTALRGEPSATAKADILSPSGMNKEQTEGVLAREVVKQIVEQAHLVVGKNGASIKLHLKPEFLGNLKLMISVDNGTLHARFTADNALVANLIEARIPELQQALADHGISWHQISVSVDAQSSAFASSHQNNFQNNGSGSQNPYTYGMRNEPYAQDDYLDQATKEYRGIKSAVDYLV